MTQVSALLALVAALCLSACSKAPSPKKAQREATRRVISLAPSLTEWVYELGAQGDLVARSARCDQPPEALTKPSAGGLFPPDLELILSFKPSDALMIEGHEVFKGTLTRFGVKVHTLQPSTLSDLWGLVEELGVILDRREASRRWIEGAQAELQASLKRAPARSASPPKVLIEVWPKPLSVAGAESFMGDLVRIAGGQPVPKGLGAWPQLPLESLVTLNPDVIFVSSPQRVAELLSPDAPRAWRALSAIQAGRVYAREGKLERPNPSLIQELSWLTERLHQPAQR